MNIRKNVKSIISVCNIVCAGLMLVLLFLQFVPFWYSIDGVYLTQQEYEAVKSLGSSTSVWDALVEYETEMVSIASAVWFPEGGADAGVEMSHLTVLLCGSIGVIICLKNRKSTLSGTFPLFCAYAGLGLAVQTSTLWQSFGIVPMLLILPALALCGCHVWKVVTWFTVEEKVYVAMWK